MCKNEKCKNGISSSDDVYLTSFILNWLELGVMDKIYELVNIVSEAPAGSRVKIVSNEVIILPDGDRKEISKTFFTDMESLIMILERIVYSMNDFWESSEEIVDKKAVENILTNLKGNKKGIPTGKKQIALKRVDFSETLHDSFEEVNLTLMDLIDEVIEMAKRFELKDTKEVFVNPEIDYENFDFRKNSKITLTHEKTNEKKSFHYTHFLSNFNALVPVEFNETPPLKEQKEDPPSIEKEFRTNLDELVTIFKGLGLI